MINAIKDTMKNNNISIYKKYENGNIEEIDIDLFLYNNCRDIIDKYTSMLEKENIKIN